MRSDKTLIVQAAAQAQKAADFILGQTANESKAVDNGNVKPPEPMEAAA